jgi:glycosidase
MLFSTSNVVSGDWSGKTSDLSRTACGEYWYYKGQWYESNPEDTVKPTISSFTANKTGTVSETVNFTISASDNSGLKSAVICYDTTEIKKVELSGVNVTEVIEWNTATVKNGTYNIKCVVYDGAGNACESQVITLTTKNGNLPPLVSISGPTKARADSTATFNANAVDQNGGDIVSYAWTVTGATIEGSSTGSSVKVKIPASTGAKLTISVTVKDDEGASASATKDVESTQETQGDFREESIYFLMTARFYDGDKTNNQYSWDEGGEYLKKTAGDWAWRGDFAGLIEKLDYIKALGFSAIWITPVVENSSGIDYHGYHASDFKKVDPRLAKTGQDSMVAYQELIDACHAKGIKVIQDIVLNHTGNFGEAGLFKMFDTSKTHITEEGRTNMPVWDPTKTEYGYGHQVLKKVLNGQDYNTMKDPYGARVASLKEDSNDTDLIYHHCKNTDWNNESVQLGSIAGDCVDLNTEHPTVFNYLIDAYNQYIDMGVDGFRIDTVKHISRLTFNNEFIPAFKERGGDDFFIFGETCARYNGRWNEGVPAISPSFYTWKETENFAWSKTDKSVNSKSASAHFERYKSSFTAPHSGTPNHLLKGNDYHKPDWSKRSHLDQIDFPLHWAMRDVNVAFDTAKNTNDQDFNDATFNVTYIDSHDYSPDTMEKQRFSGYWPDKLNLIFTFRGIPCIYYGSEIEFKKGMPIDPANDRTSLENSGRAYFGDHLEGTVTASDYGEYTASGTVAQTLNHDLAQHIIKLNKMRRAVPALQKGQYSTENCSGNIAFKRRYTDNGEDSFVLVAINGGATFSNVPNGTYVDLVTGDKKSGSTISTGSIGQGNMRVYVLQNDTATKYGATKQIGKAGAYLK